ncbi:prephenate dehydrogenase [bacterium]|nr:prephenate dehydrogenase [bacterium]
MNRQVGIVGVGLIGASIGRALKERNLCRRVIGIGRSPHSLAEAMNAGAIDEAHERIGPELSQAEFVIVATPVPLVVEMVRRLWTVVSPEAVITDVASTKGSILDALDRLDPYHQRVAEFVGSHPMAGSHKRGPAASDPDLFVGRTCVVVRGRRTSDLTFDRVSAFWRSLGMDVQEMPAVEHDERVARISHLPHVASFALALACHEQDLLLAGPGFRDTTRLAGSPPALWAEILKENRPQVLPAIDSFLEKLSELRSLIEQEQWDELEMKLRDANRIMGLLGNSSHPRSSGV